MSPRPAVAVDADFPGGNIAVDAVTDDLIEVHQELRDTVGDWFYWYFRVRGGAGRRLTIRFTGPEPAPFTARGPAVSLDTGLSWYWLGADSVSGTSFTFDVPAGADEVRFSFAMPYLEADLRRFLRSYDDPDDYRCAELARSEQHRSVELLRIGGRDQPRHRVLLTCRHHACEMMASRVLEGVMARVMDGVDPVGRWLGENVEFLIVPFVDKDGVEAGDQGKNRAPHDHNRDYGPTGGRYASVRAIRDLVRDPRTGRIDMAIDLHDPWMFGPDHESISLVGGPDAAIWTEVERFAAQLERSSVGPLPYRSSANTPYGTSWNTDANCPAPLQSNNGFLDTVPQVAMHLTLEFPYASADDHEVTAETSRLFGADLAQAIHDHLRSTPGSEPRP